MWLQQGISLRYICMQPLHLYGGIKMKINSIKYTENEIYTSMIKLFKDEEISKIIITDNILRIRYGGIKKIK